MNAVMPSRKSSVAKSRIVSARTFALCGRNSSVESLAEQALHRLDRQRRVCGDLARPFPRGVAERASSSTTMSSSPNASDSAASRSRPNIAMRHAA